ncbi:RusA family crossover junction endodeoxyribonuclease [Streptococcus agalactiae]|uniref:RusA family crossover junction endodeoxyribonuclease n=2 Tax=Streptococcus agalactiae TaxID=1311 RepID=UPI0002BA6324|nr:RusA family crossover junction endodeoxyribonuclease [Streptococcus agalactiae]EPT42892.1 hypothetical protein SAG0029_08400 [Streptococcus agalactiae FSL S3-501]EPV89988.1 hypothetical protein SAG0023_06330 [Streptococcus agalactiae FSL S3-105]EPV98113.1 hypothetical protein SAG0027_11060 [Streptococcus agalactiae FSL S3-251]MCC9683546.1 RusA family crossover junction endodeoxyribonuclease [Streptococcus agalactiae]MCQ3822875.1 RusA family crossover junction endodeoxyribonuclease [Streptoc
MTFKTEFEIPIEPKPQTRPKFSKWGTYEDPKMKKWRKQVTGWIEKNYDGPFFDGCIKVEVTFYMKAPKTLSKEPTQRSKDKTIQIYQNFVRELIWHVKKPDIDNLVKAIFDSISDAGYDKIQKSGIVWSDDNIVCDLRAIKKYSPNPRIKVKIEEIDERTNG